MSLGYAQKLSYREDVGTVGMSESFDPPVILEQKIEELANMMKKSKHLVAFTGAGISTSCGIPDFRGPKGVWTLQHEGKGVPEASLPFHCATPSLTHMALVELEKIGMLKFVISQNVDCLHLRSGMPREKLAELHGNSFRELCSSCGEEYIRDFEIETIGMKATSRRCSSVNCGAKLQDTVLDWEDALPEKEMDIAEKQCKTADVVLCLGTSLQITPACNLPLKCIRGGGKFVIVNLQQTPKDKKAGLVIHGLVDKVIAGVMQILNLRIPPYVRVDLIQLYLSHSQKSKKNVKWTLRISSIHGLKAPLPFLNSVEVSFPERSSMKTAVLRTQPFCLIRDTKRSKPFKMALKLNFGEGCGCQSSVIEWPVNFLVTFESFRYEKEVIFEKLKVTALDDLQCGQNAVIERKVTPRNETSTHAIVTNFRIYGDSIVPKTCERNTSDNRSSDMHNSCNIAGETKEEDIGIGETAPSDNRHDSGNGDMGMPLEKVDDGIQDDISDNQAPSSKIFKSGYGDLKMLTAEVDVDYVSENFRKVKDSGEDLSEEAIGIKHSERIEIIDTTKEREGSVLC